MPVIAHSNLPSFKRLKAEGEKVLSKKRADKQTIRELHIGLLNMMPDAALEATERQFFRLIGQSNQIAQFYIHPFSLDCIERGDNAKKHINTYYDSFENIKEEGLDALIITGANITQPELEKEPFYDELKNIVNWSYENVTSTLCSCLATHAVMQFRYQKKRIRLDKKCWGVYPHTVVDRSHPLVNNVNTLLDVPHSRFNQITAKQFIDAGLKILVSSNKGVNLAVSEDLIRIVFFQGHPEYDTVSLLKEYKREVKLFLQGINKEYPNFPDNYLCLQSKAILREYRQNLINNKATIDDFPDPIINNKINNTWHDSASAVVNNWIGLVYQLTNANRKKPFMKKIDINNPLNIL